MKSLAEILAELFNVQPQDIPTPDNVRHLHNIHENADGCPVYSARQITVIWNNIMTAPVNAARIALDVKAFECVSGASTLLQHGVDTVHPSRMDRPDELLSAALAELLSHVETAHGIRF